MIATNRDEDLSGKETLNCLQSTQQALTEATFVICVALFRKRLVEDPQEGTRIGHGRDLVTNA